MLDFVKGIKGIQKNSAHVRLVAPQTEAGGQQSLGAPRGERGGCKIEYGVLSLSGFPTTWVETQCKSYFTRRAHIDLDSIGWRGEGGVRTGCRAWQVLTVVTARAHPPRLLHVLLDLLDQLCAVYCRPTLVGKPTAQHVSGACTSRSLRHTYYWDTHWRISSELCGRK
jgi:hypothetical protein